MSACTDRLYPISAESLDEAVSELARRAAHYQEGFRLLMAIKTRSGLVGRVIDRRSAEAVQKAVGSRYRVGYYIPDYVQRRPRTFLIQSLDDEGNAIPGARWHWSFELATKDEQRLTAEDLDHQIDRYRDGAGKYLKYAADLPQLVRQYNAACDYMRDVRGSVETLLLYANQH